MARGKKIKTGKEVIAAWLKAKGLRAFPFQEEAWQAFVDGKSGIVNAPTGFGKTFSVFLGVVIDWINQKELVMASMATESSICCLRETVISLY